MLFCERQCALIHLESVWEDNVLTVEGKLLHERVDDGFGESRGDVRVSRGVRLRSLALGLIGRADVVEFHRRGPPGTSAPVGAVRLPGVAGWWVPFPVEYKRGKPKPDDCDRVQLCAQALCLEEMLGVRIDRGAIFYGQPRRRQEVSFDETLRGVTRNAASRLVSLMEAGRTPPPPEGARCANCSLVEKCLPRVSNGSRSARRYMEEQLPRSDNAALPPDLSGTNGDGI